MIILGIETSCDETGLCIIESENGTIKVLGNQLYSQVAKHQEFGGVLPNLAKREHAKNLVPLFKKCLEEAVLTSSLVKGECHSDDKAVDLAKLSEIEKILSREPELFVELKELLETIEKPKIDAIAVTNGPGLEPALWVGVTFAKALNAAWNIPIIPTNHMEGHIVVASLSPSLDKEGLGAVEKTWHLAPTTHPAIALLISGGHTQLVLIKDKLDYKIIGNTKDDAVGEAFDKVARMLGLPYPGGPQVSKYADTWKTKNISLQTFKFPRPMINSKDLDFSFSGLKTSVLYTIKKIENLTEEMKQEIAFEFQKAVVDVLIAKTKMAIMEYGAQTLIAGGGVIANKDIREALKNLATELSVEFQLPEISASTDNALMIAIAGFINILANKKPTIDFRANGNLSL